VGVTPGALVRHENGGRPWYARVPEVPVPAEPGVHAWKISLTHDSPSGQPALGSQAMHQADPVIARSPVVPHQMSLAVWMFRAPSSEADHSGSW
jgi:hypothetical protein